MTTHKPPQGPSGPKLNAALRANLRRRKAQMQARAEGAAVDEAAGVRYSGFAAREKDQTPED
jgi:hypothetical protein